MEREYPSPIPVVACAVTNNRRILILKRAIEPGRGQWALPAGYVEPGESAEEAIVRELMEETTLELSVEYFSSSGKDLGDGRAFLSLIFFSRAGTSHVVIDDESLDWKWVPLIASEIESFDWAFPNHMAAALKLATRESPERF